jgi:hypothetical protein
MSFVVAVLTLVLLAAVLFVISGPLRAARRPAEDPRAARRAELEAAREAKYREIRDAEMDYRTGKLSRADYDVVDGTLRTEAVEILGRLEAVEGENLDNQEPQNLDNQEPQGQKDTNLDVRHEPDAHEDGDATRAS